MSDPDDPRLEVRPAGDKGLGVFARLPIPSGQRILILGGWLLPTTQLSDDLLALQVDDDLWLCSDGSLLDDMINHSCDPNAGFSTGEPILFALRDIAEGEELTWNYSTSINEAGWTLTCRCGSAKCRGVVRPWSELPRDERDRLRPIALRYLRNRPDEFRSVRHR